MADKGAQVKNSGNRDASRADLETRPRKVRFTVAVTPPVLERLRDAAWWERVTVSDLVEGALQEHLQRLEKRRGKRYQRRGGELRVGRPIMAAKEEGQ